MPVLAAFSYAEVPGQRQLVLIEATNLLHRQLRLSQTGNQDHFDRRHFDLNPALNDILHELGLPPLEPVDQQEHANFNDSELSRMSSPSTLHRAADEDSARSYSTRMVFAWEEDKTGGFQLLSPSAWDPSAQMVPGAIPWTAGSPEVSDLSSEVDTLPRLTDMAGMDSRTWTMDWDANPALQQDSESGMPLMRSGIGVLIAEYPDNALWRTLLQCEM